MMTPRWQDVLATGLLLTGTGGAAQGQPPSLPPSAARPAGAVLLPAACPPARPAGPFSKASARGSLLHRADWPETALGSTIDLHFQTHITNAAAARMALYDYDFVRNSDQLNTRGRDRVRLIAGLVGRSPFPVVVERTPDAPELAEKRRRAVLGELTALSGAVPADRVVVGLPLATPLRGVEAELIYQNLLRLTESYGTTPSTGVRGGTGGATGGGAAGGAGTGSSTGR